MCMETNLQWQRGPCLLCPLKPFYVQHLYTNLDPSYAILCKNIKNEHKLQKANHVTLDGNGSR